MARSEKTCPGDCSKCPLLANNEVDMIPCILDQTFQRIQRMEKTITEIKAKVLAEKSPANFASADADAEEEDEEEDEEQEADVVKQTANNKNNGQSNQNMQ